MEVGALQSKQIQKSQVNYGSGWVGPGLTRKKIIGKSSQNSPSLVLIFGKYTMCILFVYALLKVVAYYDLRVLSMSVMGFPKKFG